MRLFKDFEFAVFDNEHYRVVNGVADFIERETAKDGVQILDICQSVPNCSWLS
jgi:hypothetical protein